MKNLLPLTILLCSIATLRCTKGADSAAAKTTGSGGSMARFAIAGNYLYIVDHQDLKTYNISNAADPALKSTTPVGFEIETIYPFKDKLFIGSTSVVHIFSIDDPEHPQKLSTAISPEVIRRCDPVVAKDTVAYATLRTNGPCGGVQSILAVYDIKDVLNPKQKTSLPLAEPGGLGYADSALYVCDREQLLVYNIASAWEPRFTGNFFSTGDQYIDLIAYHNTLICWTKLGIILYDITNRLHPVLITKIT